MLPAKVEFERPNDPSAFEEKLFWLTHCTTTALISPNACFNRRISDGKPPPFIVKANHLSNHVQHAAAGFLVYAHAYSFGSSHSANVHHSHRPGEYLPCIEPQHITFPLVPNTKSSSAQPSMSNPLTETRGVVAKVEAKTPRNLTK